MPTRIPQKINSFLSKQRCVSSFTKRSGDIFFSLVVLTLGFPVFLVLAYLVKLSSPGPVFYIQERIGKNYSRFGCIKFRTMREDAETILSNVLEQSPAMKQEFDRDFKLRKDPRITPIGSFLRRSSLAELPQFINILIGDMSLVGPRPIVEKEIPKYGDMMDIVVSLRPGLTGLWQVSGRNNLSYKRRVELDLIYSRERTFLIDLRIFIRTFGVLLLPMDRGAY